MLLNRLEHRHDEGDPHGDLQEAAAKVLRSALVATVFALIYCEIVYL